MYNHRFGKYCKVIADSYTVIISRNKNDNKFCFKMILMTTWFN